MKGLLAPQNTFLDTIATRFDGTRESGLGLRTAGEGDARGALPHGGSFLFPPPPGGSLVPEAGNEESEARELPASLSCLASPQLCRRGGRQVPSAFHALRGGSEGAEARLPAGKLRAALGLPPRPGQPRDRPGKARSEPAGQGFARRVEESILLSAPSLEGVRNVPKS